MAEAMASCPGGIWSKSSKLFCPFPRNRHIGNGKWPAHIAFSHTSWCSKPFTNPHTHQAAVASMPRVVNGNNSVFIFSPPTEGPIGSGRRPPVFPWPKSRHSGKQHKVYVPQESTNKEVSLSVICICILTYTAEHECTMKHVM